MRILVEVPGGEWAGAWGAEAEVRRAVLAVLPSSVAWHVARDIIRESAAGVRVGLVGPGVWSVLRAPLVLCVLLAAGAAVWVCALRWTAWSLVSRISENTRTSFL